MAVGAVSWNPLTGSMTVALFNATSLVGRGVSRGGPHLRVDDAVVVRNARMPRLLVACEGGHTNALGGDGVEQLRLDFERLTTGEAAVESATNHLGEFDAVHEELEFVGQELDEARVLYAVPRDCVPVLGRPVLKHRDLAVWHRIFLVLDEFLGDVVEFVGTEIVVGLDGVEDVKAHDARQGPVRLLACPRLSRRELGNAPRRATVGLFGAVVEGLAYSECASAFKKVRQIEEVGIVPADDVDVGLDEVVPKPQQQVLFGVLALERVDGDPFDRGARTNQEDVVFRGGRPSRRPRAPWRVG